MKITKYSKACVSMIVSMVYLINVSLDLDLGVSEEAISNFIIGLGPLLVYLVPNLKDD
jgi:hypothetical protein